MISELLGTGGRGETDKDFAQTVSLIKEYKFSQVHISQFYPRPGTPAARMKKVPSNIVKNRSRELTSVFEAFTPYNGMESRVERIWITDIAADGIHLVGHTKGYIQVLVVAAESMLGASAIVKITSVGRWSVFGEVIETLSQIDEKAASNRRISSQVRCAPCSNQDDSCACSNDPHCGTCGPESCGGEIALEESRVSRIDKLLEDRSSRNLMGWLLRKRKNHVHKVENDIALGSMKKQECVGGSIGGWDVIDKALLGGMLFSFLTIVAVIIHLGYRTTPIQMKLLLYWVLQNFGIEIFY
ncbi:hypothetical protein Patl1_07375 [Pistacia atlantica]|uniref:Uncharacterized protein n=1 Tax=Pistacia atlantica TaxID=434234 RepID=A0ACC1AGF1_9ROSI|nr:hypothetical protein Patl1_07375 [Pistacia atlantica]